jgi:large repetitive protein
MNDQARLGYGEDPTVLLSGASAAVPAALAPVDDAMIGVELAGSYRVHGVLGEVAHLHAAADRDTWVLQSASSSNFGNDSILKVDTKSGGNARALVRFALPAIPAGCSVTGATLRLYSGSYKEGRTLQAFRLASTFTETTVNWGNQPGTTGTAATAPSRSSPGYVEWSVTSHVQGMYVTNTGFLIRDAIENGGGLEQSFNSREKGADNPPQLVVTFG